MNGAIVSPPAHPTPVDQLRRVADELAARHLELQSLLVHLPAHLEEPTRFATIDVRSAAAALNRVIRHLELVARTEGARG